MSFYAWWVEEFGGPPLPHQGELFRACQLAYERGMDHGPKLPSYEERTDRLKAWNEKAVIIEDYAKALVGIAFRFNEDPIAVYDMTRCIDILIERGLPFEQASDIVWTADIGSWSGTSTPSFVQFFR